MRQWTKDSGQPVRQISVYQLSIMDKPGTLPVDPRPIEDESAVNLAEPDHMQEGEDGAITLHYMEHEDVYEEESDDDLEAFPLISFNM